MKILFASYANIDITNLIQQKYDAGQRIFRADANMIGDPQVNVVKYLTIEYEINDFRETVSVPDTQSVTIPRTNLMPALLDYTHHWSNYGYPKPMIYDKYTVWVPPVTIDDYYYLVCTRPSEIHEHLPTIKKYAQLCDHVTEMGVSAGKSSWAIVAARPRVHRLYDINPGCDDAIRRRLAIDAGIDYRFETADTGNPALQIEQTDLLFIDTWHTYDQLRKEFELHAHKVNKYIILHDTTIYGDSPEPGSYQGTVVPLANPDKGLWPAVEEFLEANAEWQILERFHNNSGLTVLGKN